MNLENYYACFESVVPSRICDNIIADAEQRVIETAITGEYKEAPTDQKDISKLYKTRNSSIVWMNDPWIYREILPYVKEANKICNWNFEYYAPDFKLHLTPSSTIENQNKPEHLYAITARILQNLKNLSIIRF